MTNGILLSLRLFQRTFGMMGFGTDMMFPWRYFINHEDDFPVILSFSFF